MMERRGGCCIAVYGAAGGSADVAWKVGRIMLRYRPIAPRPACAATAAAVSPVVTAAPTDPCASARRPKRKGMANSSSSSGGRGRKVKKTEAASTTAVSVSSSKEDMKSSSSSSSSCSSVVTLPLMPETPERKGEPLESPKLSPTDPSSPPSALAPAWLWQGNGERSVTAGLVVVPRPVQAVGSWVTVEGVTDTWREGEVHWRSDAAVRVALSADDSPGFVSDAWDRITWTNEAYRAMVVGSSSSSSVACKRGEEEEGEGVPAGLVTQGLLAAAGACRAFTCRVRVRYPRRPGRGNTSSLAAACDVWRMDGGGCAWRLDVKTALSLSL